MLTDDIFIFFLSLSVGTLGSPDCECHVWVLVSILSFFKQSKHFEFALSSFCVNLQLCRLKLASQPAVENKS